MATGADELAAYHHKIQQEFETLSHIKADGLTALPDDTVLFDVRETDEFEVSHLEGAIRVSPDISQAEFMREFGELVKDKSIVFYCSVGYRSSQLAALVKNDLQIAGSQEVYNLEGGIFNWHNERRNLVNIDGPSDDIHPFNRKWGRLLERPRNIRYHPN